jgi:hypothetical protein
LCFQLLSPPLVGLQGWVAALPRDALDITRERQKQAQEKGKKEEIQE